MAEWLMWSNAHRRIAWHRPLWNGRFASPDVHG